MLSLCVCVSLSALSLIHSLSGVLSPCAFLLCLVSSVLFSMSYSSLADYFALSLRAMQENRTRWRDESQDVQRQERIVQISADPEAVAFARYLLAAKYLKDSPVIKNLVLKLKEFYGLPDEEAPKAFFAVGAPSGSGKTQLAFSLGMCDSLDVVHICLVRSQFDPQNVYRHPSIAVLSEFLRCAIVDDCKLVDNGSALSAFSLLDNIFRPLKTIEFLSVAFNLLGMDGRPVRTARALRDVVKQLPVGSKLPVLVVDEAFQKSATAKNSEFTLAMESALYLRAVMRAVGIGSIFMGTTLNTVEFVQQSDGSTDQGRPRPWVYFICNLPRVISPIGIDFEAIANPSVKSFLEMISARYYHVNPRLLRQFCEAAIAEPSASLDLLAAKVSELTFSQKGGLRTLQGIRAQTLYQLNSMDVSREHTFVTAHFARYNADAELVIYNNELHVKGDKLEGDEWQPTCHFPSSCEDPLLALVLGGSCVPGMSVGPHTPQFLLKVAGKVPLTSAAALVLTLIKADRDSSNYCLPLSNAKAIKRNGNVVEAVAIVACNTASRAGGLHGIKASDFLRYVATEVQSVAGKVALQYAAGHEDLLHQLWSNAEMKIQYTTRLEDEFPKDLASAGGFDVGLLERTKDADMCDARHTSSFGDIDFIAEAKNYKTLFVENCTKSSSGGVGVGVVRAVLRRFSASNGSPPLGIAVVSRLANLADDVTSTIECRDLLDDINLIHIKMKNDGLQVIQFGKKNKLDQDPTVACKARVLCFIECDEDQIRRDLAQHLPDVAKKFGQRRSNRRIPGR